MTCTSISPFVCKWVLGNHLSLAEREPRRIAIQRIALATLLISGAVLAAGATVVVLPKVVLLAAAAFMVIGISVFYNFQALPKPNVEPILLDGKGKTARQKAQIVASNFSWNRLVLFKEWDYRSADHCDEALQVAVEFLKILGRQRLLDPTNQQKVNRMLTMLDLEYPHKPIYRDPIFSVVPKAWFEILMMPVNPSTKRDYQAWSAELSSSSSLHVSTCYSDYIHKRASDESLSDDHFRPDEAARKFFAGMINNAPNGKPLVLDVWDLNVLERAELLASAFDKGIQLCFSDRFYNGPVDLQKSSTVLRDAYEWSIYDAAWFIKKMAETSKLSGNEAAINQQLANLACIWNGVRISPSFILTHDTIEFYGFTGNIEKTPIRFTLQRLTNITKRLVHVYQRSTPNDKEEKGPILKTYQPWT